MSTLYKFLNCRLLRDGAIIKEDLWTRNGKILDPRDVFWQEKNQADVEIDCGGLILAPGLIDLQINGKLCL
jgi:N-acetylglucosamine-6-phosphate deacetylase